MIDLGIHCAGLYIAGVLMGTGGLVWLLVRALSGVPVVHAWNPETHEKITCYALELLRTEERPTLLGWVIQQWRDDSSILKEVFGDHGFLQLRRGSIDEDMNSDLMFSLSESNWVWRGLGKVTQGYHEGTNGGYHFYNPLSENDKKGLSDPVDVSIYLKKYGGDTGILRGLERPMPSARERAFKTHTSGTWWMDREGRNYSLGDATRYYEKGYLHLAFYAAGRVAHLLQDMAVPAHVRDDAHFGMLGNPADPLEYFAAQQDWRADGLPDSVPSKTRWLFDPTRAWEPRQQQHLSDARSLLSGDDGQLASLREGSEPIEVFFDRLAKRTHEQHYSRGTIPGNGDAHHPKDPDIRFPWAVEASPDFDKCRPSVGGLLAVFERLNKLALAVIDAAEDPGLSIAGGSRELPLASDPPSPWSHYTRHAEWSTKLGNLLEARSGRFATSSKDLLIHLDYLRMIDQRLGEMKDLPPTSTLPPTSSHEVMDLGRFEGWDTQEELRRLDKKASIEASIDTFQEGYADLEPRLLRQKLERQLIAEALEDWLLDHPDRKRLSSLFKGIHGPYCLINHLEDFKEKGESELALVRRQYDDCESRAIAYTAAFLDRWFESLYSGRPERGVTVWRNRDAPRRSDQPDLQQSGDPINNGEAIAVPEHTCTLGIGNNLPAAVDLEITLAHVQPEESDPSYEFAQRVFSDGLPVTGIVDQLSGRVRSDIYRPSRAECTKSLSLDDQRPIDITVRNLRPHSLPGVEELVLPDEGGILREDEADELKRIPLIPDSSDGGELVEAAVLRIDFGELVSEPEQGVPRSDGQRETAPTSFRSQIGRDEPENMYGERVMR